MTRCHFCGDDLQDEDFGGAVSPEIEARLVDAKGGPVCIGCVEAHCLCAGCGGVTLIDAAFLDPLDDGRCCHDCVAERDDALREHDADLQQQAAMARHWTR